jgi:hypothetical protein
VEAGVVWGKELYFDATKVEANASLEFDEVTFSLMEHGLEEHLAGIFPEEEQPQGGANTLQTTAVGPAGQEESQALLEANTRQHRWIAQAGRQQREVVRWGYTRMADLRASVTDPDASPMQCKKKGASRLGYLTHYVVDGGKARVILDVLVTPAEVTENLPLCSSCSSGAVFVGACGHTLSPVMPPTPQPRT